MIINALLDIKLSENLKFYTVMCYGCILMTRMCYGCTDQFVMGYRLYTGIVILGKEEDLLRQSGSENAILIMHLSDTAVCSQK